MTPEIAKKMICFFQKSESETFSHLSSREKEVLELLAQGYLYKEIAEKMLVSTDTIKKHSSKIYQKLQVRSRSQAIRKYLTDSSHG